MFDGKNRSTPVLTTGGELCRVGFRKFNITTAHETQLYAVAVQRLS